MKTKLNARLLSLLLVALMVLPTMMPVISVFAADETTYVLNCDSLQPVSAGTKADGDTDTCGTDNFFTIHYSSKSKIDGSKKDFDDGFHVEQRINFGGTINLEGKPHNAVSFTTQGSAVVKIWWVSGGAGRDFGIYDENGNLVTKTKDNPSAANALYISEMTIPSEGKYYLGGIDGNNYIFKITVTTKTLDKGPRADWSTVAAPTIASVSTNENGQLAVTVNGYVDHNGADYLTIDLLEDGKVVSTAKSTSVKSEHSFLFNPVASGDYTLRATLTRAGEVDKVSGERAYSYTLPLEAPYITNVTNLGGGKAIAIWNPVREATSYDVYVDGKYYTNTTDRRISLEGLSLSEHTIKILAKGEGRSTAGEEISFNANAEAGMGWNYTIYGPSAKPTNNSATVNSDGSITLKSSNNGGKLQPTGADGLGFYYTAIPSDQNFTFRVTISVDSWVFTNGQEGFGLMVTDHVPSADYSADDFWTNQYQAVATKIEYRYQDTDDGYELLTNDTGIGTKYSMKLGIGTISKIGIDQSIIDRTALGETGLIVGQNGYLKTVVQTLEARAGLLGKGEGTYNILGNYKGNKPEGTLDDEYLITEITLEIQKNNTGYFVTYYDQNGNVVRTVKNYEHDALEKFDSEYVYVGMFAARYATATFKDISLTLIDEKDDAPAEERPIEYITPTITVTSTDSTSNPLYELIADTNLDGTIDVLLNNVKLVEGRPVKAYQRYTEVIDISDVVKYGADNYFVVQFTPDPDQTLPLYTQLTSTNPVLFQTYLNFYKGNFHRKTIYVSPDGFYTGTGSREDPYDIVTAVNSVIPGQTIVLMEGTYKLETGLRIQRGINGTEEEPIRMIADPEAKTRPVIDFMGQGSGIVHGGNWWYFYGFDVTNSLDGQKGFQVSGNNNILCDIRTYHNGNTGIQISRYHGVDLYKHQWPADNLILNCTSYGNADTGYEDADGFAAKLTIGEGNVFDGCVAYNNADDGWDLFAKVATGSIGAVVIRNCVAYGNGYLEDGTIAGNGNGFKLGGDSLSGHHQLINCIAFNNKQKGIDSNSCPDIIVENCISYNNGSYNVAFYTNSASSTDFVGKGIISFKDESVKTTHPTIADAMVKENLKPKGNQDTSKYLNSSCYYWMGATSVNDAGAAITADMFVSLNFTGITRNADGTINMNGFLELTSKAPANAGTTGASTPNPDFSLEEDIGHNYGDTWVNTDPLVHWQECDCGDRAHIGSHTFEYVIEQEPTATKPGYKHNECTVCGYSRPSIEIPPLGNQGNGEIEIVDFASFIAWLMDFISKFFASLFGGAA